MFGDNNAKFGGFPRVNHELGQKPFSAMLGNENLHRLNPVLNQLSAFRQVVVKPQPCHQKWKKEVIFPSSLTSKMKT